VAVVVTAVVAEAAEVVAVVRPVVVEEAEEAVAVSALVPR